MEADFDNVTAFDMLHTTNDIQMLKVILPIFPTGKQMQFGIFIKMLELRHVMSAERESTASPLRAAQTDDGSFLPVDLEDLLGQLEKYAPPEFRERFSQLRNMMANADKMREMQSMMEALNFTQTNSGESNAKEPDMNDQLKNMLSKEQMELYEKFKNMM